jgi:hypothetical protein
MSSRSEAFRLRAEDVRLKIGKGDPRLNPVWENIARSFDSLAETAHECERKSVWSFDYPAGPALQTEDTHVSEGDMYRAPRRVSPSA